MFGFVVLALCGVGMMEVKREGIKGNREMNPSIPTASTDLLTPMLLAASPTTILHDGKGISAQFKTKTKMSSAQFRTKPKTHGRVQQSRPVAAFGNKKETAKQPGPTTPTIPSTPTFPPTPTTKTFLTYPSYQTNPMNHL